ncbi:MAG: amino acid permease [Planctomycetota bacterium]
MSLKREAGALTVFAVASGAMISSGLFVLPKVVFQSVGPGVSLCYLLAAALLLPALLSTAELMTAMPKAGGSYFFIDRSLGPGFGTAGGIATWASIAFKSAFALLGIGMLGAYVWGWHMSGWQVKAVASGFCLVFTFVNLLGVKHAGRVQVGLVAVLLVVLLVYVLKGLGPLRSPSASEYFPHGWNALLAGAAMVFISFGGITKVATLGEEVRRPKRDLLVGMFGSAAVVSLLYVAVVLVTVGLLPASFEAWRPMPLSQAAEQLWGRAGAVALGLAAGAAFLTTGNAGILSASRTILAMAEDGLVPQRLAQVNERTGTPTAAILLTSAFMLAIILVLDLVIFVKAASAIMVMLFITVMLAVVLMRESRIPTYQPSWRCPGYPWMQVVGILLYGFLLVELGTLPLALAAALIGGGVIWYALYAKVHVLRESALVRLAGRLAATDFDEHDLEAELSRITRERDQRMEDRFDHVIKECTVLDLHHRVSRQDLFQIIADNLADNVDMPRPKIYEALEEREAKSSTVVRPGLAIPHLVSEAVNSFQTILIRNREGVLFAEDQPPVRAVFVLAAPMEERNFYLKALMAVAEIAQDPEFDERWNEARSREALREVVLAAERRREHS